MLGKKKNRGASNMNEGKRNKDYLKGKGKGKYNNSVEKESCFFYEFNN